MLATTDASPVNERAAEVLRGWNARRRNAARERLRRDETDVEDTPSATFRRLRLAMLDAEREAFIAERDRGHIDDQVLRAALHGLDLEEATLNLD
ncbi:hypothetical protein C1Y40_03516 [Mycobacterium talmoniae]|uniref:Na+/H+ antiporter n=1 Tax=Mycobacterium talmoniae TaxID=1858794 RepID=A0A2S8BI11_9MYCO|nr:hypothetical protein C1Y40_03516 [Mycobacterium talmoniae]